MLGSATEFLISERIENSDYLGTFNSWSEVVSNELTKIQTYGAYPKLFTVDLLYIPCCHE